VSSLFVVTSKNSREKREMGKEERRRRVTRKGKKKALW
jgi:hypothetical protein